MMLLFPNPDSRFRGNDGVLPPKSSKSFENDLYSRGFTIAELMVAIVLTSLIIVVAMAFFMYQTTHGREATTTRASRESLSLALLMLRQDIMHAGFGVADKPELALYLSNQSGDAYTRLYVNNSTYLSEAFKTTGYFKLASLTWGPVVLGPYDVGGLIADNVGSTNRIATLTCNNPSGPSPYSYTVTLGGIPMADNFAPVISYALVQDDSLKRYALTRNGKVLLGDDPSDATAARDRTLRVTGFRVFAMFFTKIGGVQRECWSPGLPVGVASGTSTAAFNTLPAADLRLVEATIQYQLRAESEKLVAGVTESVWSPTFSKTIRVAPRTVTLAAY